MKRIVGLGMFIALCLIVCYFVDRNGGNSNGSETYGEYNRRTGKVLSDEESQDATKQDEESRITDNLIEEENEKGTVTEDSEEKIKKQLTKKAFITFDDGPSENTYKVLEALDEYDAKATFFMIGGQITPEMEDLVKSMVEKGHAIGVHTYTHNRKEMYANKQACLEDITKTYDRLVEVTGVKPSFYRFPYGSANCYISGYCNEVIRELKGMGLEYIDWNVTGEDSVGKPTKYSIMKNLSTFKNYMEPVILLHDGKGNKLIAEILPEILKKIKDAGYEFGTLDERSELYQWPHDWQEK